MGYNIPTMDTLIKVQNPSEEPDIVRTGAGVPVNAPDWGTEIWANRRDQNPFLELSEGAIVRGGNVVFVIRKYITVEANAVVLERDDAGVFSLEYTLAGHPVSRGGANGGLFEEFLELHCEARSARVA